MPTCFMCMSHIVRGNSVLTMCECFNKPICQLCARIFMASWNQGSGNSTLYDRGLVCLICKGVTPITNGRAAKEEEKALVRRGALKLLHRTSKRALAAAAVQELLLKYHESGIKGVIQTNEFPVYAFSNYSKAAYLLELARLETKRMVVEFFPKRRDEPLPLGPLAAVKLKRNCLLEEFLLHTKTLNLNQNAPFFNAFDDWLTVDAEGSISPLNDEMQRIFPLEKELSSDCRKMVAVRYNALWEERDEDGRCRGAAAETAWEQTPTAPAQSLPSPSPSLSPSTSALLDLAHPYTSFREFCNALTAQYSSRYEESDMPILQAFIHPESISSAITRSGLCIPSSRPLSKEEAATAQAVVEEELAQLEDSFQCKMNLEEVVEGDEEEERGGEGGGYDNDLHEFMEVDEDDTGANSNAEGDAQRRLGSSLVDRMGDADHEGFDPVPAVDARGAEQQRNEAAAAAFLSSPVVADCLPPLLPPPPSPLLPVSPRGRAPSHTSSMSRRDFVALDHAAMGAFCLIVAAPDCLSVKRLDSSSSSDMASASSRPLGPVEDSHTAFLRRLVDPGYRGSVVFPIRFTLPTGEICDSVSIMSTRLSLTALCNEIEVQLHFKGSIEQVRYPTHCHCFVAVNGCLSVSVSVYLPLCV